MAKRGLPALLVALLICLVVALPAQASFHDITDPELAKIVDELAAKGIISGFVDGSYRPQQDLTRAQMAKLVAKAKEIPTTSAAAESITFPDLAAGYWATGDIKATAAAGIMRGYPDGTFRPDQTITRAELARMLRRAVGVPVMTPAKASYPDVYSTYWAFSEIETVSHYGIMGGYKDGMFRPAQPASRAEIAEAIYNMLNANIEQPTGPPSTDDGKIIIAVDAGHGGSDPGAVAKSNGLKEKDVNLAVALKLESLLRGVGYEVVMVRRTDVFVSLSDRALIANNANADIFVSIHHNANGTDTVEGTAVYSYPGSEKGAALAQMIQTELVRQFGWDGVSGKDDGIKTANFAVLRGTVMPAALTESAYLSNPAEAALLATDEFRQKEAQAIFNGIVNFVNTYKVQ